MARTRQVKPEIFKDTKFAKLSVYARLLYLSLPGVADREGRLLDDLNEAFNESFKKAKPEIKIKYLK